MSQLLPCGLLQEHLYLATLTTGTALSGGWLHKLRDAAQVVPTSGATLANGIGQRFPEQF